MSRIQDLCKTLGRPVLLTDSIARHLRAKLEPLAAWEVRGISQPVSLHAPAL